MIIQEEKNPRCEPGKDMRPGIYIINEEEKRFIATLDDIIYGGEEDRREIGHDIVNFIRDVAVDLETGEDGATHRIIRLVIIQ